MDRKIKRAMDPSRDLERRRLPELRCDHMKNIDGWRAFYKMNSSDCNSKTVSSDSNEVSITVD